MVRKRSLLWHIFFPFLFIGLLFLLFTSWYSYRILKRIYYEKTSIDLKTHALMFSTLITEPLIGKDAVRIRSLVSSSARDIGERITVIAPAGNVIADSEEPPEKLEDHSDRPEFLAAIRGRVGNSVRYSYTLKKDMMYIAVPVKAGTATLAVVRTSTPVQLVTKDILSNYYRLDLLAGIVLVLVAITALWLSRQLRRSIRTLQEGVGQYSQGYFSGKMYEHRYRELGQLAESLNRMAAHIQERLELSDRQKNELESVFSDMTEGILVVDREERIQRINQAASRMFGISTDSACSRSIQEAIRNSDLIRFIQKTVSAGTPTEDTIQVLDPDERFLQAHGTTIVDRSGETSGVLIVLNDITRIARLESIRKDFVANVSHELKTPITSIKGFVETLQDGALADRKNAGRFLSIIAKHVDRLNAIIDDLLDLSHLEQHSDRKEVVLKASDIVTVAKKAIASCRAKAKSKKIRIVFAGGKKIRAEINPPLLEQAVTNLVDNAVKYSENGTTVEVSCEKTAGQIRIRVKDQGWGIPRKHLARIFERFYRVDKARSCGLGGTGLGLSIVKHIVQAHGGQVTVESTVGRGSTFTIVL